MTADDDELVAVVERERSLLRPVVRADRARLERLLHPDFEEFGASGRVWDRDAIIDALVSDPAPSGSPGAFTPMRLAVDAVLVTYRVDGDRPSLRSSIWLRNGPAGWQLRFHQGTPLP
ncbi:DUF4440 domain-containing protein [Geodermatophilus sp. CPCC 206100]|uniref:nuclear transport factor 2 family protein n=1 Tax=Geodermatophilus sp. CPCC 206100 TaxID=3020054 RepID=UPI003B009930